jgi:hypothetical protein
MSLLLHRDSQLESFRELAAERTRYAHEPLVIMIQLQHLLTTPLR